MNACFPSRAGRAVLSLILLLPGFPGLTQIPYFRVYRPDLEKPAAQYTSVLCDGQGFIWVGSSKGVYRFDGTDFTRYAVERDGAVTHVTALGLDTSGAVVAGLKSGTLVRVSGDSLVPFDFEEGQPTKSVTAVTVARDGTLWVTTAGEGVYFRSQGKLYHIGSDDGLNDNYAYCALTAGDGSVWIGTDQGIAVCRADPKRKIVRQLRYADGLPDEIILDMKFDAGGDILIATQDKGICTYRLRDQRIVTAASDGWTFGQASRISAGPQDVWVAATNGILSRRKGGPPRWHEFESSGDAAFSNAVDVVRDLAGGVWVVNGQHVVYSTGNGFNFLHEADGVRLHDIKAVLVNRDGGLVCSSGPSVIVLHPGSGGYTVEQHRVVATEKPIDIVSLYEDAWGYLWIGTVGDGLYRMNARTGVVRKVQGIPGGENTSVLSINGREGKMWLATFGGIVCATMTGSPDADPVTCSFESPDPEYGLGNYYIYQVFVDSRGRVWFATDGKGLIVFEAGQFRSFPTAPGLSTEVVYSITEDGKGDIWFSTANSGVYCVQSGGVKRFGIGNGLRAETLSVLAHDGHDHILMVHDRGIDLLDTRTGMIEYFGEENDLADLGAGLNAVARDSSGRMWLGTRNGLIAYDPAFRTAYAGPQAVIRRVTLMADTSVIADGATLQHDQHDLLFDFSSIWYRNPSNVRHAYRLDGYNNEWFQTRDRKVFFSGLLPGTYRFRLKSFEFDNMPQASEASFTFTIEEPLWKRLWFQAMTILVLSFAVMLYLRNRDRRLRNIEALKKEKIEFQFETLKSQVNPHFLFNSFNTLISVIEKDKDLAVEYVEELSDFFRNVVGFKDRELISLHEELELAGTYYRIQKKRFGPNLIMNVHIDDRLLGRRVPPLVLQILLENAIKHNAVSAHTPLTIDVYTVENRLYVKNTLNPKKSIEPSTGTGLQNVKNRYQLLAREKVKVEQDGSFFIVSLPLIKP